MQRYFIKKGYVSEKHRVTLAQSDILERRHYSTDDTLGRMTFSHGIILSSLNVCFKNILIGFNIKLTDI